MLKRLPSHVILIILLSLVTMTGLGYWLSTQLEWKEKTINHGYSEAARKNPFLAASQFLALQGIQAYSIRSFTLLDQFSWQGKALGRHDTVILLNNYKMLQGQRLQRLLDWVDAGGTLIVSTRNPFMGDQGTPDPLLERLGIARQEEAVEYFYDDSEEDDDSDYYEGDTSTDTDTLDTNTPDTAPNLIPRNPPDVKSTPESKAETGDSTKIGDSTKDEHDPENTRRYRCNDSELKLPVTLRGESQPLMIDFSEGLAFDFFGDEPYLWVGDDDGVHLALFEQGQGRILVSSDNEIWTNTRIDCHDHAYLLWKQVNSQGIVWFLMNQEAPSLWAKLWQATPMGASAALMALAFWLWAISRRFGPILTRISNGRRNLAEHIHASAMLLWRRRQHPYLVTLLRHQLLRDIHQHLPAFEHWKRSEQLAYLHQLSGLAPELIETALFSLDLQHPHAFTQAVACLQTLRKHL